MRATIVRSDGGGIAFTPEAKLFEPGQKAIIGWNGEEEVLILSIDVSSSVDTKAIEIVPLPSAPKITKGSHLSFLYSDYLVKKATEILKKEYEAKHLNDFSAGGDLKGSRNREPPKSTRKAMICRPRPSAKRRKWRRPDSSSWPGEMGP